MATQRYSQFSYLPDAKNGCEYWIFGYNSEKPGDQPEHVEKKPFGELFIRFVDTDGDFLEKIRATLDRFAALRSPEDYIRIWPDLRDAVWKLDAVTEQMPPVFIDFVTVLDYFFKEYLINPSQKPDFGKSDIEKMARGARILCDYCSRIIMRRDGLLDTIAKGCFMPGNLESTAEALTGDARIIESALQARCIFIQRDRGETLELCFDAGADLGGFTTAFFAALVQSGMGITACGNCGRPFVSAGRTIYCDRPIKGGTCRAVGALSKYNRKLSDDPLAADYRREYKKHYAQMMKGALTREQFEAWKKENKR